MPRGPSVRPADSYEYAASTHRGLAPSVAALMRPVPGNRHARESGRAVGDCRTCGQAHGEHGGVRQHCRVANRRLPGAIRPDQNAETARKLDHKRFGIIRAPKPADLQAAQVHGPLQGLVR
jgi:hypothetical protein